MRHSLLFLSTVLTVLLPVSSGHAESLMNSSDFSDYFLGSFSVAQAYDPGRNDLDRAANVIFSLNQNFAIAGNVVDTQYASEKPQNAAILFTFLVKSSF